MTKAVHKALSMFPEDVALLKELAERAGIKESSYVRLLLKREKALIDKKKGNFAECPVSEDEKTSDESEGPDEDVNLGAFSTNKLPQFRSNYNWVRFFDQLYMKYLWLKCKTEWKFYLQDLLNFTIKNPKRFVATYEEMTTPDGEYMISINKEEYHGYQQN